MGNHLDKVKLWGKAIRVVPSKHTTVQLPKDGQPDAGLTKDYGNSNLHRFKKPGSKNYSNIYPPSPTLHLSNIPSGVEEEDLKKAFLNINVTVQAFKFFPKDRKMALVQLPTVDEAITALVKLHNSGFLSPRAQSKYSENPVRRSILEKFRCNHC